MPRPWGGLILASMVTLALTNASFSQSFMQQFMPSGALESPQALGMSPEDSPPDLDEPQIGEDPETAPMAQDEGEDAEATPRAPKKQRFFHGQSHTLASPRPLVERWRRILRDGPLGGGMDLWFTRRPARDVYFIALDTSAHDRYFSLGAKHAIRGDFSQAGWRFMSTLGIKVAAYEPPLTGRISYLDLVRMMPGYEARFGGLTLSGYAGLGYARSQVRGILATGRFGRYGGSALGEFWYNWGELAPALARFTSGYVIGETANRSVSVGLRHGLPVPGMAFLIGPEANWSAGKDIKGGGGLLHSAFRKGRIGLHASEIPLFAARLRVSGGAQWQDGRKPGAYAELAAYLAY